MFEVNTYTDIDKCFKWLDGVLTDSLNKARKEIIVEVKSESPMSSAQRGALHVWCDQVAKVLNEGGYTFDSLHPITKVELSRPWDKMLVKEFLYKPTLSNFCEKTSTEDQSSVEPSVIVNALAKAYAMHVGVTLPFFPSKRGNDYGG